MEAKGVTFSMVKGLVGFLKTNMPSVQQAVDDFPNPNQKLIFPAISVMTKSPVYVPFQPYVIAKGEKDLATGKYPVTKVMGSWDFSFQIDLWAESKPARHALQDEFLNAMNKNPVDHGISLQLADYHNEWVRYDLTSIEFVDSEGESQMSEWRIIATVLANVRDIRESVDYLMEQIENKIVAATDELPNPPATPPVLII